MGLLILGGPLLLAPRFSLAESIPHAVPAAETAISSLLPAGAEIVGSRFVDPNTAEVLIRTRGEVSTVVMRQSAAGVWQQDMQATLSRGAAEMQAMAEAQAGQLSIPAFGQAAPESLLESTQSASTLLEPLDPEQETQRALSGAGRNNPFQPLNAAPVAVEPPPPPPLPEPPPAPELPALPDLDLAPTPPPVVQETPPPTPTPDPAAFAKTVQVSGVISIGQDDFALVSSSGSIPAVVQPGEAYETATVEQISVNDGQVIITEGGERLVKPIDGPPEAPAEDQQ